MTLRELIQELQGEPGEYDDIMDIEVELVDEYGQISGIQAVQPANNMQIWSELSFEEPL